MRYVNLANTNPAPPYTEWDGAATNIQDAIDMADAGDEIVVTNGVYQTVGDAVNVVAVANPLVVRSVNGPEVTVGVVANLSSPKAVTLAFDTIPVFQISQSFRKGGNLRSRPNLTVTGSTASIVFRGWKGAA